MLNEFENVLGKDMTLIIGDASLGVNMINIITTPNVTIKRKLNTRFRVLSIEEFSNDRRVSSYFTLLQFKF